MRHRSPLAAVAVAAVAALIPLACSSDDAASTKTAKHGTTTSSADGTTTTVEGTGTESGPTTSGAPATAPVSTPVADVMKKPVGPGTPADLGGEVTVTLAGTKRIDVQAHVPGETSGPAVAATLTVRNDSKDPFDLSSLAVTATYGDGTPAIASSSDPARNLTGVLRPGGSADGVYVFRAPAKESDSLVIEAQSSARRNVVHFTVR